MTQPVALRLVNEAAELATGTAYETALATVMRYFIERVDVLAADQASTADRVDLAIDLQGRKLAAAVARLDNYDAFLKGARRPKGGR